MIDTSYNEILECDNCCDTTCECLSNTRASCCKCSGINEHNYCSNCSERLLSCCSCSTDETECIVVSETGYGCCVHIERDPDFWCEHCISKYPKAYILAKQGTN